MRKINQLPLKCSNDEKTDIYWHLSFLKSTQTSNSKVVDRINAILSIKLNVAYQAKKTKVFFSNKDKISKDVSSNVVYKYQCCQCPGPHIYWRDKKTPFDENRRTCQRSIHFQRSQSTPIRATKAKLHTLLPNKVHHNRRSSCVQYRPIKVQNEQHSPTF